MFYVNYYSERRTLHVYTKMHDFMTLYKDRQEKTRNLVPAHLQEILIYRRREFTSLSAS